MTDARRGKNRCLGRSAQIEHEVIPFRHSSNPRQRQLSMANLAKSAAKKAHRVPGLKSRGQSAVDKDQQKALPVAREKNGV